MVRQDSTVLEEEELDPEPYPPNLDRGVRSQKKEKNSVFATKKSPQYLYLTVNPINIVDQWHVRACLFLNVHVEISFFKVNFCYRQVSIGRSTYTHHTTPHRTDHHESVALSLSLSMGYLYPDYDVAYQAYSSRVGRFFVG